MNLTEVAARMETGLNGHTQILGELIQDIGDDNHYGVCALGALALGNGYTPNGIFEKLDGLYWPTRTKNTRVPTCPTNQPCHSWTSNHPNVRKISFAVAHLNDNHEWTVKQIADWIRALAA